MWCAAVRRLWKTSGVLSKPRFQDTEAVLQALKASTARPSRPSLRRGSRPPWTSCSASRTGLCRPTPSRKPSTTSWTPLIAWPLPNAWTSGSTPATGSTPRIRILPQDAGQLETLHTQRFRFSPVQWVYRGLQQRDQDAQEGRLRVQKLPLLQGEDFAIARRLPQLLTKNRFFSTRRPFVGKGFDDPGHSYKLSGTPRSKWGRCTKSGAWHLHHAPLVVLGSVSPSDRRAPRRARWTCGQRGRGGSSAAPRPWRPP